MNTSNEPSHLAWMSAGVCAQTGGEQFFPDKGESIADAKRVCRSCDVKAQCLAYALANRETQGVWGATSPRQRARMRKKVADGLVQSR